MLAVAVVAAAIAGAPPASAGSVTCTYDAGTKTVTATADPTSSEFSIHRSGDQIAASGVDCGAATRFNTDTIVANDVPDHKLNAVIDLSFGALRPGASNEPGASDEIELEVNLGNAINSLIVEGTPQVDRFRAGTIFTGGFGFERWINLNAGEATGIDGDVIAKGALDSLWLTGFGGGDHLSAAGGAGTGAGSFATVHSRGLAGRDALVGGAAADDLSGGNGGDTIKAGAGADMLQGGSGGDSLRGNAQNDTLLGHGGDDHLNGGPDTDACNAGTGNNVVINCE